MLKLTLNVNNVKSQCIFAQEITTNKNTDKMKVASNNIEINKCKLVMDNLMNCVNDKSITIQERNQYYSEYLKLASNYYLLVKNAK